MGRIRDWLVGSDDGDDVAREAEAYLKREAEKRKKEEEGDGK
jgi:hypothetical protein